MMKRILFVDDEKINLMLFKVNFRNKFEVFTAEQVEEAYEILAKNTDIEVVITDMRMPGINGIDFAREIKERFSDKKVYLLTGFGLIPEIEKAIDEGVIFGYLSKPLNFKELEKIIG